jgi:phosphoserine phosphatase
VSEPSHTIALVFDFDDTLAPDSTSKVLEAAGIDPQKFWHRHRDLMSKGWDQVPGYMHMMIEESQNSGGSITRGLIQAVGHDLQFFRGVKTMFSRYKKIIEAHRGYRAQFYVVSSGLEDLIRATSIAPKLTDVWGSDFAYAKDGSICAIKNVISFTDKTRYLYQISKGLIGPEARKDPFAVNRRTSEFPVPLKNMVFVGDGYTDIPCFTVVQKAKGRAVAVYNEANRAKVGKAYGFIDDRRVSHLEPARFVKDSGADSAIRLAITHIKTRIRDTGT